MSRRPGRGLALVVALALAWSCAGDRPSPDPAVPGTSADSVKFPTLPDSLALAAPGGVAVWFSGARIGADSLGGECLERGLVIVRDTTRVLVPLLMTGTVPVLVNDSTIRARLWRDCRPGASYTVNLRTGTPTRVE